MQSVKTKITYRRWLEVQKYEKSTINYLLSLLNQANRYLLREGLGWTSEGIKSFANWVRNQGYSLGYQKKLYHGVKRYCSYLRQVEGQEIKVYLPKLKRGDVRRVALSKEELAVLEGWLNRTKEDYWLNQLLWSLFYGCGIRREEALRLELKDLNIQSKFLSSKSD